MSLTELLNLFIRDGHVSILHATHEILRRTTINLNQNSWNRIIV